MANTYSRTNELKWDFNDDSKYMLYMYMQPLSNIPRVAYRKKLFYQRRQKGLSRFKSQ